jgi:hypothetical protein
MSKIKTYGEIQYYLYDGDKKEKQVSRDAFLSSKDVNPPHNTPIKKRKTTTSLTGKVIESFEKYCKETFNGPNLPLNYNVKYDFKSYQGKQFDGGDGPSASEVPEPSKETIKKKKIKRGHIEDKDRKEKEKKYSKEYRIAKMSDMPAEDDKGKFVIDLMPRLTHTN